MKPLWVTYFGGHKCRNKSGVFVRPEMVHLPKSIILKWFVLFHLRIFHERVIPNKGTSWESGSTVRHSSGSEYPSGFPPLGSVRTLVGVDSRVGWRSWLTLSILIPKICNIWSTRKSTVVGVDCGTPHLLGGLTRISRLSITFHYFIDKFSWCRPHQVTRRHWLTLWIYWIYQKLKTFFYLKGSLWLISDKKRHN